MASANVTCPPGGHEFEADTTLRTATLTKPGGRVTNTGTADLQISTDAAAAITVAQPAGAGNMYLSPGDTDDLPPNCLSFTFKALASTYLKYSQPNRA